MSRFKVLTAEEVIELLKGRKYKYAQVHHTWQPDHADFNGSNHISLQEGMYRYHVNVRGWSDIGQHLTLFPDGKFVTGRDFDKIPAGIKGYNTGSFMIEHLGDFDKGHDELKGAQLDASLKVYKYLTEECGADIMFHTEHASKSCPGTGLDKNWFVNQVANYKEGEIEPTVTLHPTQTKVKTKVISFVLGFGDKGERVKDLQEKLIKLGYDLGKYGADGVLGRDSKNAILKYQKDHGLLVDGLAGEKTFASIEKELAKLGKRQDPIYPYPGYLIMLKNPLMHDKNVGRIQKRLNEVMKSGLKIDNYYGHLSEKAVRDFQKKYGLKVDGVVGSVSWKQLF